MKTSDSAVRPTSFALFTPKAPNLNIGFHTLMYRGNTPESIQESEGMVTMQIPHTIGQMVAYTEPLWKGSTITKPFSVLPMFPFGKNSEEE
jgi:hypothetical protein